MIRTETKVFIIFLWVMNLAFSSSASELSEYSLFKFPRVPETPKIVSVSHSAPISGQAVTVYAYITGQVQNSECCAGVCAYECEPNCNLLACGVTDFTGEADPRIVPNPTCIPNTQDSSDGAATAVCKKSSTTNPKLFYYFQKNPATVKSAAMTYDSNSGYFKADIPKADLDLFSIGDEVTYYVVASDNRGNVVSQVPSLTDVPCSSAVAALWVSSLSTPSIDNCSVMNSYEQCGAWKSGTPSCGTSYTLNDPVGDTCGENGNVISGQSQVDILGVSVGIGNGFTEIPSQKVVCAKVNLSANAPDVGSNEIPISAYIVNFINPDIIDSNPDDAFMTNATVITYAPGIAGVEPNMVSVLWDGLCFTNSNRPDDPSYSCRLVIGGDNESRLKVNAGSKSLLFLAQDSLPNGNNIVGATSKTVKVVVQTGAIQLDGGTPYWAVDTTPAISVAQKNQSFVYGTWPTPPPAAPLAAEGQTCINGDGKSFPDGACEKAVTESADVCRIKLNPSPDMNRVREYRIYRADANDVSAAISGGPIKIFTSNLNSVNTFDDAISVLDGKTYYYFFSSFHSSLGETPPSEMSVSRCTVEDWAAPSAAPQDFVCATPEGYDNRCRCSWTSDTVADPSIVKFKVVRDSTVVRNSLPAVTGVINYENTDTTFYNVAGQSYVYSVVAIDAGDNESPAATATCLAEDLKAPAKISDFGVLPMSGATTLDATLTWDGASDSDAAYYDIYKCHNSSVDTSCVTFPHANWIKANFTPIDHLGAGVRHEQIIVDVPDTGDKSSDMNYCFFIQACDDCDTAGTCNVTGDGIPNCSSFDTLPRYRRCIEDTEPPNVQRPATPQNVVAVPLPEGGKCKITWDKVTTQSTGVPFDNTSNPSNMDLDKYAVMSAPLGETPGTNPFLADPVATVGKSESPTYIHQGLNSGTTYQYYVIAYDSNSNFSDPQSQVVTCTPTAAPPPQSPTNISASPYVTIGNNYGVKITYTNSSSYADSGNSGGHSIYFCLDSACATKTKINQSLETADYSSTPYVLTSLAVSAGDYYFAVSYVTENGAESALAISASPVSMAGEPGESAKISISKKFVENRLVECDSSDPECKTGVIKMVEAPFAGAVIRIVSDSTGSVVKETPLNSDGSVPEINLDLSTEASPGVKYKVVLHIPAESYTGYAGDCENQNVVNTEGCDIEIFDANTYASGETKTGAARAIVNKDGKGGDVGNANGDNAVNIFDLAAIKPAYNKNVSSQCYRVWADFNLDGNVNIFDLAVLKANYNKTIILAPGETLNPILVKDNYPYKGTADVCCETGTCE